MRILLPMLLALMTVPVEAQSRRFAKEPIIDPYTLENVEKLAIYLQETCGDLETVGSRYVCDNNARVSFKEKNPARGSAQYCDAHYVGKNVDELTVLFWSLRDQAKLARRHTVSDRKPGEIYQAFLDAEAECVATLLRDEGIHQIRRPE